MKKRYLIIFVPFIAIAIIIIFRHKVYPTNEEIISYIKNNKGYTTEIEYTIKNSNDIYTKDAQLNCYDGISEIDFAHSFSKVYSLDGKITIRDNGYEYMTKSNNDIVFSLANVNNIFREDDKKYIDIVIEKIEEQRDEWGENEYLVLQCSINNSNKHLNRLDLIIDKKKKVPLMIRVYDDKGMEQVKILYKSFKYI